MDRWIDFSPNSCAEVVDFKGSTIDTVVSGP